MADQPTSLIKFMGQKQDAKGKRLNWARAGRDGYPFRSSGPPPMLRDEEWEESTTRVGDFHWRWFNLDDPKDSEEFIRAKEKIINGWGIEIYIQRIITEKSRYVYLEWAEGYIEHSKMTQGPISRNRK